MNLFDYIWNLKIIVVLGKNNQNFNGNHAEDRKLNGDTVETCCSRFHERREGREEEQNLKNHSSQNRHRHTVWCEQFTPSRLAEDQTCLKWWHGSVTLQLPPPRQMACKTLICHSLGPIWCELLSQNQNAPFRTVVLIYTQSKSHSKPFDNTQHDESGTEKSTWVSSSSKTSNRHRWLISFPRVLFSVHQLTKTKTSTTTTKTTWT